MRWASRVLLSLATASWASLWAWAGPTAAPRYNILFCFADDWGRYARAYAALENRPTVNQVVQTPALDRVAREGVLFRHAFVNAPSCTPCRSALVSGRYWWNTGLGAILQGAQWDSKIPSFPLLLQAAGYHIGKSFKVWSPGTPADAPFGGQQFAYQKAGNTCNNFSENVTRMMREGLSLETARQKVLAEVRANFDAFLADRKAGQPWFYWFGPTTTHRAWVKGSGQALWGIQPDSLKGRLPKFLPDVPEVREDLADYLGEVQAFDAYVGALLQRLEELGELDRTVVVLSGDNGAPGFPKGKCNLYDFGVAAALLVRWPGGKPGRVVDDFVTLMDLAPTFLEVGCAALPSGMNGRSLVPVLRSDRSGLIDPSRTFAITGRERHVAAAREGNLPYPHRAIRTADFLYIRNFKPDRWPMGSPGSVTETSAPPVETIERSTYVAFADMDASPTKAWLIAHRNHPDWQWYYHQAFAKRPAEELYDLRRDPDQVTNLAANPAYATTKAELADQLLRVLRDTGDPRVVGPGDAYDRPPFSDPVTPPPNSKPRARKQAPNR